MEETTACLFVVSVSYCCVTNYHKLLASCNRHVLSHSFRAPAEWAHQTWVPSRCHRLLPFRSLWSLSKLTWCWPNSVSCTCSTVFLLSAGPLSVPISGPLLWWGLLTVHIKASRETSQLSEDLFKALYKELPFD